MTRHIQGIGYLLTEDGHFALTVYLLLTLPGVLLHELSHAVTAWLLRVRVGRFSIGISRKRGAPHPRGRQVALGSVEIGRTDPIRASLIGLAPLVSGCVATLLISSQIFGIDRVGVFGIQSFWQELGGITKTPDFWLWAYLVFAVGNAMFPSAADRHAWWLAILFIVFVGAILYLAGLWDDLAARFGGWIQNGMDYLTYAFAMTIVIDVIFGAILFLIEQGLGLLGFGRIDYRAR
ncbi:MAG: hypothetical protein JXA89_11395 [Anaerolineae bacterium]|nr:hypothetical protein [Anaerolineae bacterium]